MIRVIYRWHVEPDRRDDFVAAWRDATDRIRHEETGALGSTLLQPPEEPNTWIGLARWRSRDDVEAFWASGRAAPLPGATLSSIEVLEERAHLTTEQVALPIVASTGDSASSSDMPRILPLEPPYEADVDEHLAAMMPPGVPPIGLFRTFARNLPMAAAMRGWGGYELSKSLSLSMRDRELLIDRTCARCGCEYEWGVHVAFFAARVGLSAEQVASLTHGEPGDACWSDRDRVLIALADQLHDTATIDDALFARASAVLSDEQLLDAFMLCGWYHAISFAANAAGVVNENGAPTFDSTSR